MAKRLTPEEVAAILTKGTFEDLVGAVEDGHLECKGSPYQFQQENQKQELAKDVSAIANRSARYGADGGHILIGVQTTKPQDHPGDVVDSVSPFEQMLVDPAQYLQVLEAWLGQTPEGIEIRWYPSAKDKSRGVVAITIPRQRADLWPVMLVKVLNDTSRKIDGNLAAYFERRGGHVVPLSPQELQQLLRDGHRFGTLSGQIGALTEQIKGLGQQGHAQPSPGPSQALQSYAQRRGQAVAVAGLNGVPVFALTAAPVQAISLPTLFRGRDHELVRLLANPPELRAAGFDVTAGETEIIGGKLRRALIPKARVLECWQDGTLIFVAEASGHLGWAMKAKVKGGLRINQMALAESTYLFGVLAQQVYAHAAPKPPEEVEFGLTLYEMTVNGVPAVLAPHGLKSFASQFGADLNAAPAASEVFTVRASAQLTPGRVAYQLVAAIYTWFGFSEDEIPYVVEENGVRVISPDKILKDGGPG